MLDPKTLREQILQFLSDKKLSDKEKAAFLLAAIDVIRKKFALEIEETLSNEEIFEVEGIKEEEKALARMIEFWQKKTGKDPKKRLEEILWDFFEKFLATNP